MGFATKYLQKHQFTSINISGVPTYSKLLEYIVIIPAFCEQNLTLTLESIYRSSPINCKVYVLILINYSESCDIELKKQNLNQYTALQKWCEDNYSDWLSFFPLLAKDLPSKHAGAGLARKILMDLAIKLFSESDTPEGVILSLDADTLVPENYFTEINNYSLLNSSIDCFILNFKHPIHGTEFSDGVYNAVALYELHLRYYKHILLSINYPFYHYTIGSCFGIKAKTYVKVGGMNRRKAGEDFYFLQKVFSIAKTSFIENIVLTPSPRPSWRVPFGTGPVIRKIASNPNATFETYAPFLFYNLEEFLLLIPDFYTKTIDECSKSIDHLPETISLYLKLTNTLEKIEEVKRNSASQINFVKRFYSWFDAFNVLKYLNFAREKYDGSMEIREAASSYLGIQEKNTFKLLKVLRERDNTKTSKNKATTL